MTIFPALETGKLALSDLRDLIFLRGPSTLILVSLQQLKVPDDYRFPACATADYRVQHWLRRVLRKKYGGSCDRKVRNASHDKAGCKRTDTWATSRGNYERPSRASWQTTFELHQRNERRFPFPPFIPIDRARKTHKHRLSLYTVCILTGRMPDSQ